MNLLKPGNSLPPRIGLFGGTFNPIHNGHLQAAEVVRQQFDLDQIIFIPCALPPHKTDGNLATAGDRLEMVRIAIRDRTALEVSDIEIQRGGTSYTIDTLLRLNSVYGDDATFFFLMGEDAFLEIHTWKSYHQVLGLTALIVMARPGSGQQDQTFPSLAANYAHRHLCDRYTLSKETDTLEHPEKRPIYLAPIQPVPIASTQIRDMIRIGQPTHEWVGHRVSDYIENKGLYQ